jgi:hypothetical protein
MWLNPFLRLGPLPALLCGVLGCGIGLLVAGHGLRFDGFLDIHSGRPVGLGVALRDLLAAWPIPALVFWLMLRVIARAPARLHEVAGVVGLAHLPPALVGPVVLLIDPAASLQAPSTMAVLTLVLLALGVQLLWLFQGMRHTAGRSSTAVSAAFVIAVVVAEVVSKLVIVPRAG